MRIPAVRATLFLFFLFLQTLLNAVETGKVYVANLQSNNVSVIDEATNTVIATIPVGNRPNCLAITPDGSFVYVANKGISSDVSVINTATNTVIDTISSAMVIAPFYLAITPNGSFVYVANFDSANVSVIDTATNALLALIPVTGSPNFLAITPDSSFVYVTTDDDTVFVIETATNTVIATPPVGTNPVFLATTPASSPPPLPPITVGAAVKKAQGLGIRFKYYRVSWNAVAGAAFYTVFRNGFLISKGVDETHFSDTDIEPSMIYVYEIVAYPSSSRSPIASGQVQVGPL